MRLYDAGVKRLKSRFCLNDKAFAPTSLYIKYTHEEGMEIKNRGSCNMTSGRRHDMV